MAGNGNSGRKRKPSHLRAVEGRTYREAERGKEPKASGDLFEPPAHFDEPQKVAWTYAIANAPRGLLKRIDQSVLAVWVVAWCMHQKATESLQSGPHVVKTGKGTAMPSPWVTILNQSSAALRAAASDLGFSPAARARVSVPEGGDEGDAGDEFFGRV